PSKPSAKPPPKRSRPPSASPAPSPRRSRRTCSRRPPVPLHRKPKQQPASDPDRVPGEGVPAHRRVANRVGGVPHAPEHEQVVDETGEAVHDKAPGDEVPKQQAN